MDVTGLELAMGQKGPARLIGTVSYRADLAQVCGWKNLAIKNPSHYLIGTLSGTAGITQKDQRLVGNLDARIEKLVVAGQGNVANGQPQWIALWKEPSVQLTANGSYDTAIDKLTLESSRIDVDGLSMTASGKLDECSKNKSIELAGQLAYDWEVLTKTVRSADSSEHSTHRQGPASVFDQRIARESDRQFAASSSSAVVSNGPHQFCNRTLVRNSRTAPADRRCHPISRGTRVWVGRQPTFTVLAPEQEMFPRTSIVGFVGLHPSIWLCIERRQTAFDADGLPESKSIRRGIASGKGARFD